ncbi:hypothetical protein GBAR_LOCUS27573 [Geodia barretti]|uniref:Laminin EGF-like domain-containing protein n=1 Tax=Geodia barretti TaxID=519541 RepID=A0AA35TM39_GEOBA|nr:hypothetical protein GBAR_LOCUS27573 [Geodia barretti]
MRMQGFCQQDERARNVPTDISICRLQIPRVVRAVIVMYWGQWEGVRSVIRRSGQCPCKTNVERRDCSRCSPQHYGLGEGEGDVGCLECDPECNECTGAGPQSCVACINYLDLDGTTCVSDCPVSSYPDVSSSCTPCNNSCLRFSAETYTAFPREDAPINFTLVEVASV